MLDTTVLKGVAPGAMPALITALVSMEPILVSLYQINTPRRMAHFLAQTAHESGGFHTTEEDLHYRTTTLMSLFVKHHRMTPEEAQELGGDPTLKRKAQPEKIANIVYGGKWGEKNLGNKEAGDGYRFRGRGLIQLTGRTTYTAFARAAHLTLDEAVAYVATPRGAVESAAWFWTTRHLNTLADHDDVKHVTRRVNGGETGLSDRIKYLDRAKRLLRPSLDAPLIDRRVLA